MSTKKPGLHIVKLSDVPGPKKILVKSLEEVDRSYPELNLLKEGWTWEKIIHIEPRLDYVYQKALRYRETDKKSKFCANSVWYGWPNVQEGLKHRMMHFAGVTSRDPNLRSCEVYDIAYNKIYNALPNCRHKGLCW